MNAVLHHTGAFVTNAANMLTLARIAAAPILFSLVLAHDGSLGASWAAAGLGVVMALTDKIDGMLARSHGGTRAGAFLDPLADKVVVLGGMACLYMVESYALLPVMIVWAREIAVSLWRFKWAGRGVAIPARNSAKYKTVVQGLALLFAITPGVSELRWLVQSSLWLAVGFTVVTGLQYLIDGRTTTLPTNPA